MSVDLMCRSLHCGITREEGMWESTEKVEIDRGRSEGVGVGMWMGGVED